MKPVRIIKINKNKLNKKREAATEKMFKMISQENDLNLEEGSCLIYMQ